MKDQHLSAKRVLFVGPKSYEYHRTIVQILRDKGVTVDFVGEDNLDPGFRLARLLGEKALGAYLERWWVRLEAVAKKSGFDQVLVIRGEMLRPYMMERLREILPNAEYIMYQWDSVKNHHYLPLTHYFDKVKTFDRADSEKYGFKYFPLFYDHEFERLRDQLIEQDIDLLMVGTLRSDRLEIARTIRKQARDTGLAAYFFIYVPFMTFAKKNLVGQRTGFDRTMVKFKSMPKSEYLGLLARSKVVLDINDKNQTGLTIRTLETLGAGKKLLTCNRNIGKDDFFSRNWIDIFDRDAPYLNVDFVRSVPEEKLQIDALRMDRWLMTLLGG